MKKLLISGATALAIVLSGCSTLQVQQAEDFLGKVQAYAAGACHFVPDIASIVAIWNAAAGATVAGVGGAICALVPPVASAPYRALPRYGAPLEGGAVGTFNGTPIKGWRTQ